jgi:hypothetical protein
MKDNVLLYYTSLEIACKITSNLKIRMGFLKCSKDPLEAMLAQLSYHEINSSKPAINYAEDMQIVCFAKASFPICGNNRREKNHFFNICHYSNDRSIFPSNCVLSQAMFYNYGNYGDGVCFILDREQFEKENALQGIDINYVSDPYHKYRDAWFAMNQPDSKQYDMFSFKHKSFSYENELRFFAKEKIHHYVSIVNSFFGLCMGPRLTTPYLISNITKTEGSFKQVIQQVIDNKKQLFGIDYDNNLVEHNYSDPNNITYRKDVACFGPTAFDIPEEWNTSL